MTHVDINNAIKASCSGKMDLLKAWPAKAARVLLLLDRAQALVHFPEIAEGHCCPMCRLMSMVSLHLKSQRTANMPSSIFLLRSISSLYDSFLAASNKMHLADWPLVRAHQYKKPLPGWNSTDVPAMKATRHKYDFGLVDDPNKDEHRQEQRRVHA